MSENIARIFSLIDIKHLVEFTSADVSVIGDNSIIIFNGYDKIIKINCVLEKIFITVFSSEGGATLVDENSLNEVIEKTLRLNLINN